MLNVDFNLVIKKMSKKYGIPESRIEEVMFSVGRYINHLMRLGNWDGFYMRGFGKFVVKEGKIKSLRKRLDNLMDGDDDSLSLVKNKKNV